MLYMNGKHPHVCGENHPPKAGMFTQSETPPRMWGELEAFAQHGHIRGNTPTYVGRTDHIIRAITIRQKHPHVCGENADWAMAESPARETPPRMWGEH